MILRESNSGDGDTCQTSSTCLVGSMYPGPRSQPCLMTVEQKIPEVHFEVLSAGCGYISRRGEGP